MRQLVILRHATAQDGVGMPDRGRELTAVGRREAARMGAWMLRQGLVPDHVLSSSAPRAAQTARLVCEAAGVPSAFVREEPRLYEAGPAAVLRLLAGVPPASKRVLLVGHNPTLEALAVHLTGDEDLARRGLPKAGVVAADLPDDWSDLGATCARTWIVADPHSLP